MKRKALNMAVSALLLLCGATGWAAGSVDRIEAPVPAVAVAVSHGALTLTAEGAEPIPVYIYSITGQLVKQLALQPHSSVTVELPSGYYIVKTPTSSRQYVVR